MITLLHGTEGYLVDRAARALLDDLRPKIALDFNFEDLEAETLGADAFAQAALTLPFMDSDRVLVLRDWGLLTGKRDRGGAERAASTLSELPDSTHLVLVLHEAAAAQNPILKTIVGLERDKRARIDRFDPPRRVDRAGWVRRLAEERGLSIAPGAVRLLLERVHPDLRLLEQEMAKLALYVFPETRIAEEAVRAVVSDSREEEVYALTDALASGPRGQVAVVLQSLLASGREPTYLLYLLVQHWRRLLHARAVLDKGQDLSALQGRLAEHPFVVEKAFRQAAAYTAEGLDRGLHDLLRIEEQIKLGELDARIALEGFILERVLAG